MKETTDLLGKIITNILTALYEPFGFSLLLSFLAMFFYLYAYESIGAGKGWKSAIVTWYQKFKESVFFRKLFFLAFVTSLILFRTLLNRNLCGYTGALKAPVRCFGNHLSGKGKSSFQTDNECSGAAILKK